MSTDHKAIDVDAPIGGVYGPAMEITEQREADEYFQALVDRMMRRGHPREEAERIERRNLGYFAGYYGIETRERVERLFRCSHPVFGAIAKVGKPTPEESFELGNAFVRTRADD